MNIFDNGLIVDNSTSPPTCCGFIFAFEDKSLTPNGRVDGFTQEQIRQHNDNLSKAELIGLDQNCQVGQCGTFYYSPGKGVTTWTGIVVAENGSVTVKGNSIKFTRGGKTYRGRLQKDADCFNFKRAS
jgi:hypothetical protein